MDKKKVMISFILIMIMNTTLVLAGDGFKEVSDFKVNKNVINETTTYIKERLKVPVITSEQKANISKVMNDKIQNDLESWRKEIISLAKENEEEAKKAGVAYVPFELNANYEVKYNGKEFLSIITDDYQYTGGAHGITTRIGYNFNAETGKTIKLGELFNEGFDYKAKINEVVKSEIAKNPQDYFSGKEGFVGIADRQDFYIAEDGLVIYFQLYDIAPYVSGIKEFKVPYSIIQDGLKYKL